MKIKKYIANTMKDALQKIREELGAEAVILSSKEVKKGGVLGLFQKKQIEVIAALEKQSVKSETKTIMEESVPQKSATESYDKNEDVLYELKQMRKLLATNTFQTDSFPAVMHEMYEHLQAQDIETAISREIIEHMMEEYPDVAQEDEKYRYEILHQIIVKHLQEQTFVPKDENAKIVQFVGPTGVGKTTTLAKIAALTMLEEKKNIAFITTDTYRIAAIDQLKTYARILDVPVEVAYSIEDYRQAIQKFNDYDAIFVDTAGRNFRDERYVNELKQMLYDEKESITTYLVLSLTAKNSDIIDIYKQFQTLKVEQIVFTKMDETTTYGPILNLLWDFNINVAFMTNGQNVPEDIVKPSFQQLSKLIISRKSNE